MEFILDTDRNAFESADVSNKFKDQNWSFMECLKEDIKDILSLYEAPFLALEGENLLEEAKALTRWNLENLNSRNLVKQANHALQLPLHRSTDRLTAEWSIEAHRKIKGWCKSNTSWIFHPGLQDGAVSIPKRSPRHLMKLWQKSNTLKMLFFCQFSCHRLSTTKMNLALTITCKLIVVLLSHLVGGGTLVS